MRSNLLKKCGLDLDPLRMIYEFPPSQESVPEPVNAISAPMLPRATEGVQERVAPLHPSTALLLPPYGSKGSQASAVVEPVDGRVLWGASSIERKAIVTMLADPKVKTVHEQAATIRYVGDDGNEHRHTLDLIATRWDGEKPGYMVKPETAAIEHDLRALARRVAASTPQSIATRIQPLTSRQMPKWHVQNTSLLFAVRRDRRTLVDQKVRELAPSLPTPVTIEDLCDRLGGGVEAFRPIVRAIFYGTLEFVSRGEIDETSLVRFSGQVMDDTDRNGPRVDHTLDVPPSIIRPPNRKPRKQPGSRSRS